MVLGCGYGDFRKGIDLFVQTAREIALSPSAARSGKIVLAWVGHVDGNFRAWAEKDVMELDLAELLIFPGPQRDTMPWFSAADLFFQPSREDPFPTVVLEAMATGLPVVGFASSGGIEEQLRDGGGVLVPYGDVPAAATTLCQLAGRPDERARMGKVGQEKISLMGGYHTYVGNLIGVLDMKARMSNSLAGDALQSGTS
jgi:glycosyltransferase involved in cell wall biosynthesis